MSEPSTVATAVFRLPRSAYVAVLFFGLGITVFVRHPVLITLYILPILAAVFIARRSTVIDRDTITVRAIFGTQVVRWRDVRGLIVTKRGGGIAVVTDDGTALRLPYVRARHLPLLSELTGGTVPAVPKPAADPELDPELDSEAASEPADPDRAADSIADLG